VKKDRKSVISLQCGQFGPKFQVQGVAPTNHAELCDIRDWAHKNNLKLKLAKIQEIIFVDERRKAHFSAPGMPELQRVQVLKVLGVTLTNGLSVSLHVQNVISSGLYLVPGCCCPA